MRDKVKRFISILMTALMLVNLLPVGALAEGFTISNSVQGILESPGYPVFVYVQVEGDTTGLRANKDGWFTIGMIANVEGMWAPRYSYSAYRSSVNGIRPGDIIGNIDRFTDNTDINIGDIDWTKKGFKVDEGTSGSYPQYNSGPRWHLDGTIKIQNMPSTYIVRYVDVDDGTEIGRGETVTGKMHQTKKVWVEAPDSWQYGLYTYTFHEVEGHPQRQKVPFTEQNGTLTFYYKKNTADYTVNYYLNGTTTNVADSINDTAPLGEIVTPRTEVEGYTLVPGQKTSLTIGKSGNVLDLYYYENVELTANSKTVPYNGQEQSVSGFTGAPEGADFSAITVGASGTDAGTYNAIFPDRTKGTVDGTGKYIVTEATNGQLEIKKRNVTLTSANAEKVYDGNPLTNGEVTVSGDGFANGEGATYNVTGSQTDVGSSDNEFTYVLNSNTKADNYKITESKGKLEVTAVTDKVTVTITGDTASVTYDGKPHSVEGYTVTSISNPLYTTDDFTFNGDKKAEGTNAGEYKMGLTESQFTNTSNNFTNVTFVVTDGSLTINKREVTLTSASDSKEYDGTALTNGEVTVSGDGFANGEGATYNVTGSQTDVGSSDNEFTYVLNSNTKADNYKITESKGKLEVTAVTDKVTVTITGDTASVTYDGKPHSVEGYTVTSISNPLYTTDDFTFNGDKKAEGTNAGEYKMGLTESQFTNTSNNFTNVTFVVTDGYVKITPRQVKLTSETASKAYDGTPLTRPVVKIEGSFVEGEVSDVKATGSVTNVSEGEVTNTITYTEGTNFKESNYNISKTEGKLSITETTAKVTVTIKGKTDEMPYDGKEHSVEGYEVTSISNELYKADDFTFGGTAEAKGTDAGEYKMGLTESQFTNTSNNFTNVTFVVTDGYVKITPRQVKLTSETASKAYDGTPLTRPVVKIEGSFVEGEVSDVKATGSVTNVSEGEVTNAITFTEGENFKADNYAIEKDEGKLSINKRSVMLTSADLKKVYDGTPLTNGNTPVTEMSGTEKAFPEGEGVTYTFTGSQTNVGESENKFTFKVNKGTNEKNYSFEVAFGQLEVTPVTEEVIVTITGRTDEMPYDGKEHSVFGYDVTVSNALYNPKEDMQFNGIDADATAKGTDAGTYPIGLTAEHFTNKSNNFTNVTFVVTDGYVKITPRAVTLTSETAGKTYDGTALEKPVVTVGGDGFVEGQVKEIKATGSMTNAGSVANTITFTPNKETFKDGNYAITKTEGTLTIAKRSVLITSQSATKTYDGSALTRPAVTITGDGFVPGELAKAEATGSITNVGSTPNAIQYTTTGAFNAANYSIALSVGTLTVTEKPQPEPRRTFNLTVNYVYQNGKRAAASYNRGGLKNGETFDITSPVIAGYTASETVVSGTIYNRDIKVTVIYTADGVNLDDYGVPLGLGNITMNVGDCFE